MPHKILTRRFFALAAASAFVTGGALLPTTAFADDSGSYSTLLHTDDMSQDDSGGRIGSDGWDGGHWDPGRGDHDGDGYGGGVDADDDWRTHPVCFAAPCEL